MVFKIIYTILWVVLAGLLGLVLWQLYILLKNVTNDLTPIMKQLNTTVEEINTELARLDEITKAAEDVVEKVSTTTRIAQEAVSSPLIKLVSVSAGLKKAINSFKGGHKK
ncbi:MAG: hypothetical protein C4562_01575 [Actinobacteria bacterium]|nr:MAG: hypothetical protein C4562_01575 [Actinomycetota bacterium]